MLNFRATSAVTGRSQVMSGEDLLDVVLDSCAEGEVWVVAATSDLEDIDPAKV